MSKLSLDFGKFPHAIRIAIIHLSGFAQEHGRKVCRKHGVGAFRKGMGQTPRENNVVPFTRSSENVIPITRETRPLAPWQLANAPWEEGIQQWRDALALVCDDCGRCRWARRTA